MKKHTGLLSNLTLSYDSVFLALIRMLYLPDSDFAAEQRRCIAHPTKKRPMLKENPAIEYTARAFAVLTYYKIKDDLSDESGLKRLGVGAVRPIASIANGKADLNELESIVSDRLDRITALEKAKCDSIDAPAALFGELLGGLYAYLGANEELKGTLVSVSLIFIAVILTGLDIYDNIAKFAGAGTLVPITGFANSVVSPAIDTKAEGWVLGVGAKIFTIAGPVILYGTLSSVIYGVIYAGIKMVAGLKKGKS